MSGEEAHVPGKKTLVCLSASACILVRGGGGKEVCEAS